MGRGATMGAFALAKNWVQAEKFSVALLMVAKAKRKVATIEDRETRCMQGGPIEK